MMRRVLPAPAQRYPDRDMFGPIWETAVTATRAGKRSMAGGITWTRPPEPRSWAGSTVPKTLHIGVAHEIISGIHQQHVRVFGAVLFLSLIHILGRHLVHSVGADDQKICPRFRKSSGSLSQNLRALLPLSPGLALLDFREIHAGEQKLRGMKSSQFFLNGLVYNLIVRNRTLLLFCPYRAGQGKTIFPSVMLIYYQINIMIT